MRSVRACRGFLASFLVLLGAPRSCPADRSDQRKGDRNRRVRAPRGHGRGPFGRPARAPPDGHGRPRRVSLAGAAPWRLHREVRPRGHAERHQEGRGPAPPGHGGRRQARGLRDRRDGDGDGRGIAARPRVRDHHEWPLQPGDHDPSRRPGLPRPPEAHPRGPVFAGHHARTERRGERPGQRLPVRRGQRDPAPLRDALGGARVPRHRPGDRGQGRRPRRRLRPVGRVRHGLGQQVGHQQVERAAQLPAPGRRRCPRTSTAGSSRATSRIGAGST